MEGEWEDLMNNEAVLKRVIRPSPIDPPVAPEFKQEVVVHVVGRIKDTQRVFQDTRADGKPISTFVGENILDLLPPGLMLALRQMSVGELAHVKIQSRFAFGAGAPWLGIGPETDVEYEVELLTMGELQKEVPEMTYDELEMRITICKNRGNEFFHHNELEKALRCYKEGVRYGDGALQLKQEENATISLHDKALQERIACLNNVATVLEKQGKLKEAMESTVLVLENDPRHLKSLVRAAKIAVQQGSHEEAIAAVSAAVSIAPTNPVVLDVQRDLQIRIAKYKEQEKIRWGGFLKPVPPEEAEKLRKQQEEEAKSKEPEAKQPTRQEEEEKMGGKDVGEDDGFNIEGAHDELNLEDVDDEARPVTTDDELSAETKPTGMARIIPTQLLEFLARVVVLLSPTLLAISSLLLWRLFAV